MSKHSTKRRIRIQGFLIFWSVVAVIFLPRFLFPAWKTELWDEILDVVGVFFILFGFLLRIAARGTKREHSNAGRTLVLEGPYAAIQHPMYAGTFLIGLGIICMLFTPWIFIPLFVIFMAIYIPHLRKEESDLEGRFKDDYTDYAKRTPRLLPSLKVLFNLRDYVSVKWSWLKNEWLSLTFVTVFILLVEAWRDSVLFGREELVSEPLELLTVIIAFLFLIFHFGEGTRAR